MIELHTDLPSLNSLRTIADGSDPTAETELASPASVRAAELLIAAMRDLSRVRSREGVAQVIRRTARELVGADGATFVLRDGTQCFYLDEDAITPLWKGQRFPLETCVSGWVMTHAQQVAMPDIYVDPRVPHAAYRPTFVKSLVMTPVRHVEPIAAIGTYWADYHVATARELRLLQDLADTTAVALENAQVYQELEQRVCERTAQLTQINRELEAFSHTAAHDLRSPLSAIIGFAELLEAGASTLPAESVRSFTSEIVGAARRMNDLIGALLEFARDAQVELTKVDVDLSAMTTRLVTSLRTQSDARAVVTIAPNLRAHADPALLEVVLTNLLSNALKYSSRSDPPRIEIGMSGATEGSRTFFVRDNGVGFDPSQCDKLFTPFQRLHRSGDFAGSGVGLATVARIVERHGGHVWAEGQPGVRATFFVNLPV